jgi:hypothetical protein
MLWKKRAFALPLERERERERKREEERGRERKKEEKSRKDACLKKAHQLLQRHHMRFDRYR